MNYDFGILGGGLVGSLAAALLSQQGFSVALFDPQIKKHPQVLQEIPDLRVSTLTPSSWQLLQNAGVVARLNPARYTKVLAMQIFEEADNPLLFNGSEIGRDRLATVIENQLLLEAIQAGFTDKITLVPSECQSFLKMATGFLLDTDNIQVNFLIFAQGGSTRTFKVQQAIHTKTFDFQEDALVFHVESALPHRQTAYQRFLPKPLAFLPLHQPHWSSIVWTVSRSDTDHLIQLSPEALAVKLEYTFPMLGPLKIITAVRSFPLYAEQSSPVAGSGYVLMGDMAHVVHPLAGQGVNLGFRDVAVFLKAVHSAKIRRCNLTSASIMQDYSRETFKYNQFMSHSFSLIHALYDQSLLQPLRAFGMRHLNRSNLFKKEILKFAMGDRFAPSFFHEKNGYHPY